ncbi:hypothetical protein H5410_002010 [Solanum commersonii]|uniref:Uncharacterized protein n=1 Tax=Solanum commersonii TaxID=4109 RepID=A0A9J6B0F5_SOLCO|nr:hypothetical protein H5410_002010 [Solanum commersonii]
MKAHNKAQFTYARITCVLKDSNCVTPLPKILMLAILATASSSSTKVSKCPHLTQDQKGLSKSCNGVECKGMAQNEANRAEKNEKWNHADHRVQLGKSPKRHEPPFIPVREALKEVDQKARKGAVSELPISFVKQYCTAQ